MTHRVASDSESEDEVCIIKVRREVLAPQPNTDITRQPEEKETEEQEEELVLREIERNIEEPEKHIDEPKIDREHSLRRSTREKKRPVWHDSYAMTMRWREVSIENERMRLITDLISSNVFNVSKPLINK